jgi:hypothetical protein
MNRHQRRAAAAEQRQQQRRGEIVALALQVLESLAEQDKSISGATLILPDGGVQFIDAATMRRGGAA